MMAETHRQRRSPVTTMSTSWLPQQEQTSRSRNSAKGVLGAVSSRHFDGIGTCATFGDGGFATTRPQGGCGTK